MLIVYACFDLVVAVFTFCVWVVDCVLWVDVIVLLVFKGALWFRFTNVLVWWYWCCSALTYGFCFDVGFLCVWGWCMVIVLAVVCDWLSSIVCLEWVIVDTLILFVGLGCFLMELGFRLPCLGVYRLRISLFIWLW